MSFVYFIAPEALLHRSQDDELRYVKIGYTGNKPESRLAALQCGCPAPLTLIAYIDGSAELERAFHEAFAPLRNSGEWFSAHHKLESLLVYLGADDASHVNDKYRNRAKVLSAMIDVVFSTSVPHPSVDPGEYNASADPEHLARYYPEVWK